MLDITRKEISYIRLPSSDTDIGIGEGTGAQGGTVENRNLSLDAFG
jgi:hypothetical protein